MCVLYENFHALPSTTVYDISIAVEVMGRMACKNDYIPHETMEVIA